LETIAQRLQGFITAELSAAALYRELEKYAPNDRARQLIAEIAQDEQAHADEFLRVYRMMTRQKSYTPETPEAPAFIGTFKGILRGRLLDEAEDYRKYSALYNTNDNPALRTALARAGTDENVHALRIIVMLSE
jgi:rubrerythrin